MGFFELSSSKAEPRQHVKMVENEGEKLEASRPVSCAFVLVQGLSCRTR